MSALSVNVSGILSQINDEAFNRIKGKLQVNRETFVNSREHSMAGPLLGIICDEKILSSLDRERFATVIKAVVPNDILEMKWLCKYCDLLLRAMGNLQQNTGKDERASKYANHLINRMIPEFKKLTLSSAKTSTFIEPLAFIFKISSCLLRCTAHNQYPLELTVEKASMEELEKRIFKLPGNIFGSYRNEERAYALFISWILEETIIDQDGTEGDE